MESTLCDHPGADIKLTPPIALLAMTSPPATVTPKLKTTAFEITKGNVSYSEKFRAIDETRIREYSEE